MENFIGAIFRKPSLAASAASPMMATTYLSCGPMAEAE